MKRLSLGIVLTAAIALLIPAAASAAEYETFVGCNYLTASPVPSHTCQVGDTPGAFFESDEETEYDICVEFPDGFFDCAEEQEAEADVLYVNRIFSDEPGEYLLSWFVGVVEVGSWAFHLDSPPPPAPPAPAPLPLPAPPVLPAVSVPSQGCLKAKSRVNQLKNKLQNTSERKAKAKVRSKLKAAKAAAKRAC